MLYIDVDTLISHVTCHIWRTPDCTMHCTMHPDPPSSQLHRHQPLRDAAPLCAPHLASNVADPSECAIICEHCDGVNARVVAWLPQSPPSLPLHHLVPSRLLSPAWALSPGSQHRDLGQNDLPSSYHDNCPQSLDDCTSIQSKLENPSAQCAAECRLNPPAVDIVGECECTAPAPLPPCCQL